MPKKKPIEGKPEVHEDLKGFNIKINEFGKIVSNLEVDELNDFLDENVADKKLIEKKKKEKKEVDKEEDSSL